MQELFSSQKQLLTIVFDSDTINSTNKIAKEDAAFSQTVPERNAKLGCKRFTAEKDDTTSESAWNPCKKGQAQRPATVTLLSSGPDIPGNLGGTMESYASSHIWDGRFLFLRKEEQIW